MFLGENPIHIEVLNKSDIAKLVLMPGDPLRAKYIAENFLENARCVTSVRNMLGFTGTYKGVPVTVMGSGMGMPSMGIYSFELFHFFGVEKIIRIGTCGAVSPKANINDMLLSERVYSESNFAYTFNNYRERVVMADEALNNDVMKAADELGLNDKLHKGMLTTMDVFGPYIDFERVLARIPKEYEVLGEEMEAFALVHVANSFNRQAAVMVTAVDSKFTDKIVTVEERQTSLNDMISLALDSLI